MTRTDSEYRRILGVSDDAGPREVRAAYRALAARWHPDRFQEGPERAWAESRMIEINEAYNALTKCCPSGGTDEAASLIEAGKLREAAHILLAEKTRTPEWNFLYGTLLTRRGDNERARVYLALASRACPDNMRYKNALTGCEKLLQKENDPLGGIKKLFGRKHN